MFHLIYLFYLILLHSIIATPQLNFYYTDWVSERGSESDSELQHDCLRIVIYEKGPKFHHEIMSYCMSELPSKFHVENDDLFPKFTFVELSKRNISSQQLYLWSAPIDLIELYQFYLNQLSTLNDLSLGKQIFYNCTMPRFGSKCQYELPYHHPDHSSFYEIIYDFYRTYRYNPITLTCYTHLKCDRGPYPACLDWSEVCNGQVDCLDGGLDEEYCWQLEINQCNDNEYRCMNGQCIPQSFSNDNSKIYDCIDGSDLSPMIIFSPSSCSTYQAPLFECEDVTCKHTSLTNSCVKKRHQLLLAAVHSIDNSSVPKECWSAFKCIINFLDSEYLFCSELCRQNACIPIVNDTCPDLLYFPNVPILFGDVYFVYTKNDLQYLINFPYESFYICYNNSHYNDYFLTASKMLFNNMTCVHFEWFLSQLNESSFSSESIYERNALYYRNIFELHGILKRYHLSFNYTSAICNRPTMYQCIRSSKCVSMHRLMDTIYDCPHMDDENITLIRNTTLIEQIKQTHFKCQTSNQYIPQSLVKNGVCDCEYAELEWCEDEDSDIHYLQTTILFQHICDGFIDLLPVMIAEQNETDETECAQWKCNNIYTRCNNVWNCPNGEDESSCISSSILNCSSKHHLCVSPQTNQFMCLPIEKANDGNVDCLGATDEPALCGTSRQTLYLNLLTLDDFYCMNQTSRSCIHFSYLCDGKKLCEHGDDEQFCTTNGTSSIDDGICWGDSYYDRSNVENFLCNYHVLIRQWEIIYFRLDRMIHLVEDQANNMKNIVFSGLSSIKISEQHQPRCHRGLDLRVWLNNKTSSTKSTCLCPPSYYGDQCQYQNQRISLGIKFRALSDSYQTPFAIIISLIDDSEERIVHSYEQITYLSLSDCKTKFNIYLLYSTRPKNSKQNYVIHIDLYEKLSLAYRGSVLLPVYFSFLPVHRLAFNVDIPRSDNKTQSCSNDQCIHGKCIKYSSNPENLTFCQCNQGWSGKYCTIQHTCICASNSLCIGVSANNRSICVCPVNKFGSRCLLTDTTCQTNDNSTCQNGGQCIPNGDYLIPTQTFVCICPKGFSGDRCEFVDNKLILSFDKNIILSQSIFIHFIEVIGKTEPVRASTFRTIPVRQDSVTIYWSQPFHLIFLELFKKNYYLTIVQKIYNQSTTIDKMINPSDRCPHVNELFNETFVQWHLLRRIKYYHLPCQNQLLNLSCFYDDVHLCLCYNFEEQRLANCFNFDHNMAFDCFGQSVCENGAKCFQDHPECPRRSMCICPSCFYGIKCQFSTSGFGLSLDAILGYHIIPDVSFVHQPFIIKMSLAVTIIFIVAGFISGILSMMTFKNKIVREIGCGLYLLGSSVTTLLTMIIFGLKFFILVLAQMKIISNRSFLLFQCHSIDFILRICLNMNQWLTACVATERAITAMKGIRFDKKRSKQAAKLVIIILLIVIIGTSIHDPIYRRLIDEGNNDDDNIKRTWCIVSYGHILEVYNSIIHTLHFFGPFLINLISAIILIIKKSRQQSNMQTQRPYKEILREQFRQHKHLLTAPVVLVILGLPRLIITFVCKCMISTGDSWLFLVGYFISFIEPMLTFVVFILPSKFYKKEFRRSVGQYRTILRRCLHLRSSR